MRTLLLIFCLLVAGHSSYANDLKQEIIDRCRKQMGEYGSAMVKACADQDMQAAIELSEYDEKWFPIIRRCRGQMGEYGWAMIQGCADQDIEAEKALENY